MDHHNKMAEKSVSARGFILFADLKRDFPVHWTSFNCMHKRGHGVADEFKRTREGFLSFVEYLGPVPENMILPTIGREDHSQGYFRGNFGWQSKTDNSRECAIRNRSLNHYNSPTIKKRSSFIDFCKNLPVGEYSVMELLEISGYIDTRKFKKAIKEANLEFPKFARMNECGLVTKRQPAPSAA